MHRRRRAGRSGAVRGRDAWPIRSKASITAVVSPASCDARTARRGSIALRMAVRSTSSSTTPRRCVRRSPRPTTRPSSDFFIALALVADLDAEDRVLRNDGGTEWQKRSVWATRVATIDAMPRSRSTPKAGSRSASGGRKNAPTRVGRSRGPMDEADGCRNGACTQRRDRPSRPRPHPTARDIDDVGRQDAQARCAGDHAFSSAEETADRPPGAGTMGNQAHG